jgi:hypothetical protein
MQNLLITIEVLRSIRRNETSRGNTHERHLLGRFRVDSLALTDRPEEKWGESGELVAGNEYLRPPKGVQCDRAANRACRVESVIVAKGRIEWMLPFIDIGVSGPRFIGG